MPRPCAIVYVVDPQQSNERRSFMPTTMTRATLGDSTFSVGDRFEYDRPHRPYRQVRIARLHRSGSEVIATVDERSTNSGRWASEVREIPLSRLSARSHYSRM